MPFGMKPKGLDQCVEVTGEARWPVEIEMPAEGERVYVELVDQDWFEGRVVGWTEHQFDVRTGVRSVVHPRWASIVRIVFLDRPRG